MAPKHKSAPSRNLLRSGASSSTDITPFSVQFRDEKAKSDFFENFSRRGIHFERQVILSNFSDTDLLTVIYSRGWGPLCDTPVTCPSLLIQEFYSNMHGFDYSVPYFITRVRGTRIVVTLQIVADVLRVPRVEFPNYPSCECLRIVSKEEIITAFCERPSDWGECQFTYCSGFVKGPRFLNMLMTFVLHPLSLTITLSQSLMLDFCFLLLRVLP